jgi:hypothetical protein
VWFFMSTTRALLLLHDQSLYAKVAGVNWIRLRQRSGLPQDDAPQREGGRRAEC